MFAGGDSSYIRYQVSESPPISTSSGKVQLHCNTTYIVDCSHKNVKIVVYWSQFSCANWSAITFIFQIRKYCFRLIASTPFRQFSQCEILQFPTLQRYIHRCTSNVDPWSVCEERSELCWKRWIPNTDNICDAISFFVLDTDDIFAHAYPNHKDITAHFKEAIDA
jgi:hypothetical protein